MDFDKLRVIFGYFFKANPKMRSDNYDCTNQLTQKLISLYLLNQLMDFDSLRVILEFFNTMVRSLYTSADMKKDIFITSHPIDRFWQFKSHFGVVFLVQSDGEVSVYISLHGKRHI